MRRADKETAEWLYLSKEHDERLRANRKRVAEQRQAQAEVRLMRHEDELSEKEREKHREYFRLKMEEERRRYEREEGAREKKRIEEEEKRLVHVASIPRACRNSHPQTPTRPS